MNALNYHFGLAGKTALVTGAASGIGAATARLLTELGAVVIGLDRVPVPGVAQSIEADLGSTDSIRAAAAQLDGRTLDILCNIAGVSGKAAPASVLAINFIGLRQLTEFLLPGMGAGGSIVNMASTAGRGWQTRLPDLSALLSKWQEKAFDRDLESLLFGGVDAYVFSKELLIAWTASDALRLRRTHGVRMNTVSPGPVNTPLLSEFEQTLGEARVGRIIEDGGRAGMPEDVAAVVAFLACPASSWVCGQDIAVDGGVFTAWAARETVQQH